ncbi:Sec1-like protein [Lentinula raphanica]|nr:Sec1-like protein [Lentinula raphanica]
MYTRSRGISFVYDIILYYRIHSESTLFDFRPTQIPPLLLILDRRNDPVTPLLSQWTYQVMVHELIGIQNGRVDLSSVPDIRPELSEVTLASSTDSFLQSHPLETFGDLAHSPSSINSISDMKRFIEDYPEFRKLSGNVSKHVALVGELSRLVSKHKLLEVGEEEQGLATNSGADYRDVQSIIKDNQWQDDLFSTESLLAKGRSALKGLKGVENVYTQHTPHLSQTLENIFKGRLKDTSYPLLDNPGANASLQRPQGIIIFMIGGTTQQQSATWSTGTGVSGAGTRLLLGGTCVHDSTSFSTRRYLDMVRTAVEQFPASVYGPPPESASNAPVLNLNLGGVNVSLGGNAPGVYRTSSEGVNIQTEGIRDGVMNLFRKVKQGVDRIATS